MALMIHFVDGAQLLELNNTLATTNIQLLRLSVELLVFLYPFDYVLILFLL